MPTLLYQVADAMLAAVVPPLAPTGFVRIRCRAELPQALQKLRHAQPLATK